MQIKPTKYACNIVVGKNNYNFDEENFVIRKTTTTTNKVIRLLSVLIEDCSELFIVPK